MEDKKKGTPSWKPAQKLELFEKKPGLVYRWCDTAPDNLMKKEAEGWVDVNGTTGDQVVHDRPDYVADGAPTTSANTYRDLTLKAMPRELADERKAYYERITDEAEMTLKQRAARDLGGNVSGDITINSRITR